MGETDGDEQEKSWWTEVNPRMTGVVNRQLQKRIKMRKQADNLDLAVLPLSALRQTLRPGNLVLSAPFMPPV